MKISVIIPAYNIRDYIENCIDSVRAQTHKDLEILVVDDGSTDGTGACLDQLAIEDDRIHVIHQENGGVTRARLRGVREASGEYIGFVDGDDEIEPDMYEHLLANALKYQADISHCGYSMVFPDRVDDYYNTGRLVRQDKQGGLRDLLEGAFVEPGLWNKLFHRSLFDSLLLENKIEPDIRNMEDLLMNFYLFREASSSVYEDFCPYHYLLRRDSAATAAVNEHKLKDPFRVFEILLRETEHDPQLAQIVRRRQIDALIMAATMPVKNQPAFVKIHRDEKRDELRGLLPKVLKNTQYGMRYKGKAAFAGLWPGGYGCVHALYARLTGLDTIYEIK